MTSRVRYVLGSVAIVMMAVGLLLWVASLRMVPLAVDQSYSRPPSRNSPLEDQWVQCEQVQDCIEVEGACEWTAINRRWQDVHRRAVQVQRAEFFCEPPSERTKRVALCIQNRCTLIGSGK